MRTYLASRRFIWSLSFAGAAAAALLVAGQTYLSMLDHGHAFWRMLGWQLGCFVFWGLVAPLVIGRSAAEAAVPVPGSRTARLARHAALAGGLVLVHVCLAAALATLFQPFLPIWVDSFVESLAAQLVALTYADLLLYAALVVSGVALASYRRNRELELRESRLAADLASAQLEALRLEIEPHFLFNTLNSIAALLRRRENDQALEMLLGLGELLRSTLEDGKSHEVALRQELDFVRRYLELQRARYGERLAFDFRVEEAALELAVPTLLLQPLVENAIRHGLSPRASGGRIEIGARLEGRALRLSVADDGVGLPVGFELDRCPGLGLANARSRLAQLHAGAARLEITSRGAGTEVMVLLPARSVQPVGFGDSGGRKHDAGSLAPVAAPREAATA